MIVMEILSAPEVSHLLLGMLLKEEKGAQRTLGIHLVQTTAEVIMAVMMMTMMATIIMATVVNVKVANGIKDINLIQSDLLMKSTIKGKIAKRIHSVNNRSV
jgi:hypothetical protein